MTNTALSRTERAHRRCDIDDLVTIATALCISPAVLLPLRIAHGPVTHTPDIQEALLG